MLAQQAELKLGEAAQAAVRLHRAQAALAKVELDCVAWDSPDAVLCPRVRSVTTGGEGQAGLPANGEKERGGGHQWLALRTWQPLVGGVVLMSKQKQGLPALVPVVVLREGAQATSFCFALA